jgi:tetratricopeptide (TPR) repeat protein
MSVPLLIVRLCCMRTPKFITVLLLIALNSCGQSTSRQNVDPRAVILSNKIIPLVNHIDNPDSCKQALLYLDSATKIDTNCFLCYYNKLMFFYSLREFSKAVETINHCIRIEPSAHDLHLTGGILYEKVGDTISSKKYFEKSLTILNSVLDTMKVQNMNYEMLVINKAINAIMLADNKTANDLFTALAGKRQEPELRQVILSFMNKNKKELVEMMTTATSNKP